jgi:hypothetical protein
MADWKPTITEERLLLLKGTRSSLANRDIKPGAIYFTTDYPGIYVDLAAEGIEGSDGYKAPRRLRMGDVTVVNALQDLQNLVTMIATEKDGLSTWDSESKQWSAPELSDVKKSPIAPILTDKGLYYAIEENVLCMYDETKNRFIWINDHTALNDAIKAIDTKISGIKNEITELQTAVITTIPRQIEELNTSIGDINALIGSPGPDDAYKESTVFAALENINDRIAAVLGGEGTDSIASLKKAIEDEATDRANEDIALDRRIDGLVEDIGYTKPENGPSLKELLDAVSQDLEDTKTTQDTTNQALKEADEELEKSIDAVAEDLEDETSARENADIALGEEITAVDERISALDARIGYSATQSNETFY